MNGDFVATGSKGKKSTSGEIMVFDRDTLQTISVIRTHVGSVNRVILTTQDDGTTLLISWGEIFECAINEFGKKTLESQYW